MHENFFHKLKVYYEDTDSGGVVYYANYLKFLERARTEALFSIGFSNKKIQDKFSSFIIEDELTVRSYVKSITKTSFFMNQIITRGDELIVESQVHLVFINKEGKPIKIPDEIYSKFKPYFCDSIKF